MNLGQQTSSHSLAFENSSEDVEKRKQISELEERIKAENGKALQFKQAGDINAAKRSLKTTKGYHDQLHKLREELNMNSVTDIQLSAPRASVGAVDELMAEIQDALQDISFLPSLPNVVIDEDEINAELDELMREEASRPSTLFSTTKNELSEEDEISALKEALGM